MAKEKHTTHKVVMTEVKRDVIGGLLSEYDIQSVKLVKKNSLLLLGQAVFKIPILEKNPGVLYIQDINSSCQLQVEQSSLNLFIAAC